MKHPVCFPGKLEPTTTRFQPFLDGTKIKFIGVNFCPTRAQHSERTEK